MEDGTLEACKQIDEPRGGRWKTRLRRDTRNAVEFSSQKEAVAAVTDERNSLQSVIDLLVVSATCAAKVKPAISATVSIEAGKAPSVIKPKSQSTRA
jgi:hypothetical protein